MRSSPSPKTGAATITIGAGRTQFTIPLAIEVLDVTLPQPQKPAGFYLDYAPHLLWFRSKAEAAAQASCDMAFMRRLGITGTAPPVSVPTRGGTEPIADEMRRAAAAGIAPGWLVYNPIHHLQLQWGRDRAARFAAAATSAFAREGIADVVWSAADEPSNADQAGTDLAGWVRALRHQASRQKPAQRIRLAGHLNSAADRAFADLFDVLLLNPGFGIDRNHVAGLSSPSRRVWYYNTARPRLTAGLWLHTTVADRYVQWHARMPTAHPFDPIDGREGDVQMFYPDGRICPPTPDIHRDLLRLGEGLVDQRWLTWLQRHRSAPARRLAAAIHRRVPVTWSAALALDGAAIGAIRRDIEAFARQYREPPTPRRTQGSQR